MKKIILILMTWCGIFLCMIMLFEYAIRIAGWYEYPPGLYEKSQTRAFKHVRNFLGKDGYGYEVRTNASGFRDKEYAIPKPKNVHRILVLGDSVAFGVGIRQEDTYAKQLEQMLHAKGYPSYEVINTGVRGYNTYQEVHLLKEDGLNYEPDMILVGFVLNDAEPFLRQAGMMQGWNKTLIMIKDFLKYHTYSYAFIRKRIELLRWNGSAHHYQEQYIDQFKEDHVGWQECQKAMDELGMIAQQRKIRLCVVIIPRLEYLIEPCPYQQVYVRIMRAWQARGAEVYNAQEVLRGQDPMFLRIFPADIFHLNPKGNYLLAEYMYDKIFSTQSSGK